MGRQRRVSLPGVPFHVTTRVQNREPLLLGAESLIEQRIRRIALRFGARVVAYAVMRNHLHLILIHGRSGLPILMQALLRGIALLIQRRTGREGHVFERRYYARPCLDAEYFRNAVAYVHLNPVRAGDCACADESGVTSHALYCAADGSATAHPELAVEDALRVFALDGRTRMDECIAAYRHFLDWRLEADAYVRDGGELSDLWFPTPPWCVAGDMFWDRQFAGRALAELPRIVVPPATRPDLEKIATRTLRECAPDLTLRQLRSGTRSRGVVHVRRVVIAHCLDAGYTSAQVARYLGVGTSTVSRVACGLRG